MTDRNRIFSDVTPMRDAHDFARNNLVWTILSVCMGVIPAAIDYFNPSSDNAIMLGIIIGLSTYVAGQAYQSSRTLIRITDKLDESNNLIYNNSLENNVQNALTHSVLKIFHHSDVIVRATVAGALQDFTRSIDLEGETIHLSSDYMAQEAYRQFWGLLIREQRKAKNNSEPIDVFVAHATSLTIWNDSLLLDYQEEFSLIEHGRIYRILIKNKLSLDNEETYANIARTMHRRGTIVFYIESENDEKRYIDDYLICKINETIYAMKWNADWRQSVTFGVVKGCSLSSDELFVRKVLGDWHNLVDALKEPAKKEYADPILSVRPNKEIFCKMRYPYGDYDYESVKDIPNGQ